MYVQVLSFQYIAMFTIVKMISLLSNYEPKGNFDSFVLVGIREQYISKIYRNCMIYGYVMRQCLSLVVTFDMAKSFHYNL